MSACRRVIAIAVMCASLAACALSGGRGIDPRDSAGQNGAVADGGSVPGVLSLFTGSMLVDWLQRNIFKPERDDAPPPPPLPDGVASGTSAGGDPNNARIDCGDPAQRTDANPRCK